MGVEEDDRVMDVRLTDGQGQIFLGTRNGMAIRFPESDVRAMGRTAYGVRGISLRDDDEVVAMEVVRPAVGGEVPAPGPDLPEEGAGEGPVAPADAAGGTLLSVTENGYGKRTPFGIVAPEELASIGREPSESDESGGDSVEPPEVAEAEPTGEDEDPASPSGMRYRRQRRGGKGLRDIKTTDRNGQVILTPVKKGSAEPINTGLTLEQLRAWYPKQ